jgi:hypothetical protein
MFAALLSAALLAPAAPVPKEAKASDYFPAAVGTEWVYEVDGEYTVGERVTGAAEKDGAIRLTVRATGGTVDEVYAVDKAGVTKVSVGGFTLNTTVLRLPLMEGDEWTFDTPVQKGLFAESGTVVVGKAEKVTVPAGTFEAVPVRMTATAANGEKLDAPRTVTRWYAAGVGVVKVEYHDGQVAKLKEFTPGKAEKK